MFRKWQAVAYKVVEIKTRIDIIWNGFQWMKEKKHYGWSENGRENWKPKQYSVICEVSMYNYMK